MVHARMERHVSDFKAILLILLRNAGFIHLRVLVKTVRSAPRVLIRSIPRSTPPSCINDNYINF